VLALPALALFLGGAGAQATPPAAEAPPAQLQPQDDSAWKAHMDQFGAAKQAHDLPAATRHLEAALVEAEKLGAQDPRTAVTLLNLGAVYGEMNQFAKAEPLLRRASSIFEAALGPEHAYAALSSGALAFDLTRLGKHAEAEALYRRVQASLEKAGQTETPDMFGVLSGLAEALEGQGKLDEADGLQQRALALVEAHAGAADPALQTLLEKRAGLLRKMGRTADADQAAARAAAIASAVAAQAQQDAAAPKYKGQSARQWTDEVLRGSMTAFETLTSAEKDAVPVLKEMLGHDQSRVRSVAAHGLSYVGAAALPAIAELGRALKDKDLNVRYYAGQALGNLGPAGAPAVPALIGALDTHPSREPDLEGPPRYYKDARSVAAEALAAIGPAAKAAVPRLREVAAKDDEPEVRAAAAAALKKIEP